MMTSSKELPQDGLNPVDSLELPEQPNPNNGELLIIDSSDVILQSLL
jgi:hypothetical protein